MGKYLLISECDRCKKQLVNNPPTRNSYVGHCDGLTFDDYTNSYLCEGCLKEAKELKSIHKAEKVIFVCGTGPGGEGDAIKQGKTGGKHARDARIEAS